MNRMSLVLAVALPAAFSGWQRELFAQPQSKGVKCESPHFQVNSEIADEGDCRSVAELVEAAWAAEQIILPASPPDQDPLHGVFLYKSARSYESAEAKLTKGALKSNLAFSD